MLLAALAAAALLAGGAPADSEQRSRPEDPFTYGNPAFCTPTDPVEDFGLSELPPIDGPPEDGDLPFGPKTVSLAVFAGPILPVGESVGFWLNSQNYYGRTPLRWALRSRIRPVEASGQAGPVVTRDRIRVPTIKAGKEVKLFLDPPRTPGFYRYEIEIVDFDGTRLAEYSTYVRVERKFWDARLGLNRDVFQPGQQVLSRVENFGTEGIGYGEEFRVQGYRENGWVRIPQPSRGIWLAWAGSAGPGLAGRCSALRLPRDFPPGQYRIVKEVERSSRPNSDRTYYLTAPFEVVESRG